VATLGLVFFMFFLGIELDPDMMRRQVKVALPIALSSVVVPFSLGAGLSVWIFEQYSTDAVSFPAFVLFFGAAMSFTAFPVLASILQANRLLVDPLGVLAFSCAAIDDLAAWCLLAFTTAFAAGGNPAAGIYTTLIALAYVLFMLFPVRMFLARLHRYYGYSDESSPEELDRMHVSLVCMMLLVSAFLAEIIGVHAFFGAFIAGIVVPKSGQFVHMLAPRIELIVMDFLLPLYFALSGLKLNIGTLEGKDIGALFAILACACAGKFLPTFVMARIVTKQSYRFCASLGILMNTRGLVQLIVLNIGMDLGILTPRLFSLMVIMALVTTMLTPPIFHVLYVRPLEEEQARKKHAAIRERPKVRRALLSAGGRPGTLDTAWGHKCLIPITGKPMIAHVLEGLQHAGIENVTLVVPPGDVRIKEAVRAQAAELESCSVEVLESGGGGRGFFALSLMAAIGHMGTSQDDDTMLLSTVDHMFESSILSEFANIDLKDSWDGVVLAEKYLDGVVGLPASAVFLKVDSDKVAEIGTGLVERHAVEGGLMVLRASVFFSKLSDMVKINTLGDDIRHFSLAAVMDAIARDGRLSFRSTTGRPWVAIETAVALEAHGVTDQAELSCVLMTILAESEPSVSGDDWARAISCDSFHDVMEVVRREQAKNQAEDGLVRENSVRLQDAHRKDAGLGERSLERLTIGAQAVGSEFARQCSF